ncbi:hypothetical protein ACQ4PT_006652 [Festuca glaucescens]
MMGRFRLTAAESAAVVLEDGADDFMVHSKWALVGKVLAPNPLHISTIAAALRPAWGNPRGLVFNPAVLLREFDVDQKPSDMCFNNLKVWARIMNFPFGYMHKRWGAVIARSLGIEGSVPVVDCDGTGRCWGGFMRVRVEVDVDKPLLWGVTVFSQRRNLTDWFDVQYENLPLYCFSCGIFGHSSTECKNPGERDAEGKLSYSADRLCALDERKNKSQIAKSSSGSASAGQGRSSLQPTGENPRQSTNRGRASKKDKQGDGGEVLSPAKKKNPNARTTAAKARKGQVKEKAPDQEEGEKLAGRKRKPEYRVKAPLILEAAPTSQLAMALHKNPSPQEDVVPTEEVSSDSSKKPKTSVDVRSEDQAGAVEQPCRMQ